MSAGSNVPFAATRALVRAVKDIDWEHTPDDAREVARQCLLDYLGVAVAGAQQPLSEILLHTIVAGEGSTQCGLIGRRQRASQLTAALFNGACGHALDFDDTHSAMGGHPSVPVIPALLALGETTSANGRALLEALVAGFELECRLGAMLGGGHYAIGFHNTGTVGTFGAAAACSRMLGLDEDGWLRALGLAGTQAAGLKSGFGTMAKPLHAGRAASNGLLSALAAASGFSGNTEIIETAQGFGATHAGAEPRPDVLERLAGKFLIRDNLFKYHASCYLTHAPIQAARAIQREHHLAPESIEEVEVRIARGALSVCNIQEPRTGLEGKFSLRATTAMALMGADTGALETFTDTVVTRPPLIALRDRVRVVPIDKVPATRAAVVVKSGGRSLKAEADSGEPARDLSIQRANLRDKFMALTTPILGRDAKALSEAALNADNLKTVRELVELAQPR